MRATLPTAEEGSVSVAAGHAVYDRDDAILDLDGGIEVVTDDGYELHTEAARVALEAGRLHTRTAVAATGPRGTLLADRLEVEERGAVLRFSGNVRLTLPAAGSPRERGT
jgi:lipopolysaccharide export system protein LptC